MFEVKAIGIARMGNELNVTVHVGNLESILNVKLDEMNLDAQKTILKLIQEHINNMSTSDLINKLASK